jgi:two-component system response regulator HydG
VITITIPPLRERKEDIPLLVSHFLKIYQEKNDKPLEGISEETLEILTDYKWPGNVRELKNVVERAVVLTQDNIVTPHDLPDNIVKNLVKDRKMTIPFGMPLREIEKKIIVETLKRTNGDKEITANLLGIASRTIYRKMNSLEDEKREEQ